MGVKIEERAYVREDTGTPVGRLICWLLNQHETPAGLKLDKDGNMVRCCPRCKREEI